MNLKRIYRYFKPISDVKDCENKEGYVQFYARPINFADFLSILFIVPDKAFKNPNISIVLDHIFTFKAKNGKEYIAFRFITK
jgi:hypothetical protein